MTRRELKNPAASVRARLREYARSRAESHERVLVRYAVERLLFRLSRSETPTRFVLKGAMLFVAWPRQVFRPTGDLDFLGFGSPEPAEVKKCFEAICRIEAPEDGILFDVSTLQVSPAREAETYRGVEVRLDANLDGAIIPVLVDVGFGDHVHPAPKRAMFPCILPDLPAAAILMYPPETVVAEKFEAMIRRGERNTRLKDFYDLWVISRSFSFEMAELVEAVRGTLRRRDSNVPMQTPVGLTDVYADFVEKNGLWSGFLRRSPPSFAPPAFIELQADLRAFFGPVIANLALPEGARGEWSPGAGAWR